MMNAHFINELDKIGLQFINIKGSFIGRLVAMQAEDMLRTRLISLIDDNALYPITNKLHSGIPDAVLRVPSSLCAI